MKLFKNKKISEKILSGNPAGFFNAQKRAKIHDYKAFRVQNIWPLKILCGLKATQNYIGEVEGM